jgi:hypothetical protein
MIPRTAYYPAVFAALTGILAACEPTGTPVEQAAYSPEYLGIETRLLDGDLVDFFVSMRGARDAQDVAGYAKCAAAQYALIRGYGFARHVRSNIAEKNGLWIGDSVYTISNALPRGLKTIDAEVVVSQCDENEIPKV